MEPTDLDWLALCLVTESNRPAEWPYIAQVIENRRRTGRWDDTYRSVILAPKQFSAFNSYLVRGDDFAKDLRRAWDGVLREQDRLLLMHAAVFVAENEPGAGLSTAQTWSLVISAATLHYYSPVSMKPPGSKPAWAASAKRLYTPSAVDPERFVFAEGVA